MQDFETPQWRRVCEHNGLASFDDVWNLTGAWVERPNTRHGGFGAVARCVLESPGGGQSAYYVKVHRNRTKRSALRPWRRVPALDREFGNHRRCAEAGVASPAPVYCANRLRDGEQRGILVTEELVGFRSLHSLLDEWREPAHPPATCHTVDHSLPSPLARRWSADCPPPEERGHLIDAIAARLRALHDAGLVVRSFTPKHIFVKANGALDGDGVQLIDLERIRPTPFRRRASVSDLTTLWLAMRGTSHADQQRFVASYLGRDASGPQVRKLWRRVCAAGGKKAERRSLAAARRAQSSAKGVYRTSRIS